MKEMVLLVLIGAFTAAAVFAGGIRGDGAIVRREQTVPAFERIAIPGSTKVTFHQSGDSRVIFEIDSNLEEYLDIAVRNQILGIGTKPGRNIRPTKFTVDVYAPSLSGVSISGAAVFTAADKITTDSFDVSISGSGKIGGDIECGAYSASISGSGAVEGGVVCGGFDARISGSGHAAISGSAKDARFDIGGSGKIDGKDFRCENAAVHIGGSGNIHLWVVETLTASISGSGDLVYRGNPKIDYHGSGVGRIRSE